MNFDSGPHVKGRHVHPFYKSIKRDVQHILNWSFNKVLIMPSSDVIEICNSRSNPMPSKITKKIEGLLT